MGPDSRAPSSTAALDRVEDAGEATVAKVVRGFRQQRTDPFIDLAEFPRDLLLPAAAAHPRQPVAAGDRRNGLLRDSRRREQLDSRSVEGVQDTPGKVRDRVEGVPVVVSDDGSGELAGHAMAKGATFDEQPPQA